MTYKRSSEQRRKESLAHRYGISPEAYDRILEAQGGRCAICGDEPGVKRLAVDEDHETGKVRGLLCELCNRGIGLLRESPFVMESAVRYLESPPATLRMLVGA